MKKQISFKPGALVKYDMSYGPGNGEVWEHEPWRNELIEAGNWDAALYGEYDELLMTAERVGMFIKTIHIGTELHSRKVHIVLFDERLYETEEEALVAV